LDFDYRKASGRCGADFRAAVAILSIGWGSKAEWPTMSRIAGRVLLHRRALFGALQTFMRRRSGRGGDASRQRRHNTIGRIRSCLEAELGTVPPHNGMDRPRSDGVNGNAAEAQLIRERSAP
jgi:hypothetical protein